MTGIIAAIVAGVLALSVPFFRYAAKERIILAKLKDEAAVLSELPDGEARRLLGHLMHQRIEIYVRLARPTGDSAVDVILLGFVTIVVGLAALVWALILTPDLVKASEAAQFLAIAGVVLVLVGPLVMLFADRLAGGHRRLTRESTDGHPPVVSQDDASEKARGSRLGPSARGRQE